MTKCRILMITVLVFSFFLISCGGGGESGGGVQPTTSLPPDPGVAGKQTIEGIDSDGDGVRDDVQRYIKLTYSDAPTQQALVQYAKAQQVMMLASTSKEQAIANATAIVKSIECLSSVHSDDFTEVMQATRLQLLNTEARVRAYITANSQASGAVFAVTDSEESASSCR